MTHYHGGKKKIGLEIAQKIFEVCQEEGFQPKGYIEPFCGMLGVYQHIPKLFGKITYKAGDINESVIKMWKEVKKGWVPPTNCPESKFYRLKGDGKSSAEKGFIGHAAAYRGIYFITYDDRRNIKQQSKYVTDLKNTIKPIQFKTGEYTQFSGAKNCVIYCDPPYFKWSKYTDELNKYRKFDYEAFYEWVEMMTENNFIFVSEKVKLPYELVEKFSNDEKLYFI